MSDFYVLIKRRGPAVKACIHTIQESGAMSTVGGENAARGYFSVVRQTCGVRFLRLDNLEAGIELRLNE